MILLRVVFLWLSFARPAAVATPTDTGATGVDSGAPADTGVPGDSGASPGDSGPDSGDSGPDSGDSGPDSGDSGPDSGDSGPDSGDSGTPCDTACDSGGCDTAPCATTDSAATDTDIGHTAGYLAGERGGCGCAGTPSVLGAGLVAALAGLLTAASRRVPPPRPASVSPAPPRPSRSP